MSTQPTSITNQYKQLTLQKLVNVNSQFNFKNNQQTTNAPTPYYIPAASTQTYSPLVRCNTQMTLPDLGESVPMQQSLRPIDGTDPTYITKNF